MPKARSRARSKKIKIPFEDLPVYNRTYATFKSRYLSYAGWKNYRVRVRELAEAGFYFSGYNDLVVCYHCGVKKEHWEHLEEPFVEHANIRTDCPFVIHNEKSMFPKLMKKHGLPPYPLYVASATYRNF